MSDPRETRGGEHVSGSPQAAPGGCQPLPVWLEVCAGTMTDDASMMHLQHAAECRDCSSLLAEANAILGVELSREEKAVLDRLATSSSTGQLHLAKLLHTQTSEFRKQPAPHRSWSFLVPIFSWGATAACIIAIAVVLLLRQPSDATLLAEAYNQQRPSQLRLPGTEPGPLASPTRGSKTTPDSTQLLRLKLRTEQSFEQKPNEPGIRQTLGRIALVEHDGESAHRNFEMAEALDPKLPGLTFDLASAYFELAESTSNSLDYARAIDLYSQHLNKLHNNDPVALYNRALCWERTGVFQEAIADLHAALALESDSRWRAEIQSRMDRLKQISDQSSLPQQPPSAAAFLSASDDPPGAFEQSLSVASRDWLPRRTSDLQHPTQIDAALHKAALVGLAHHDHWLEDMLDTPATGPQRAADQALSQALTAGAAGDTDTDLAASAHAAQLYRQLHNQPGYLRAAVEHLYALQRMGRSEDCLHEAATLSGNPQLARYSWLRTFLQLAESGAYSMFGDARRARSVAALARADFSSDLPISSLRSTGVIVYNDALLKRYQSAWQEGSAALRSSANVRGASLPRFQVLFNLLRSAGDLGLDWTRVGLAEAATAQATATSNRRTTAYAFEELGLDQLQIGNLTAAHNNFRSADKLLASLGNGPAIQRVAADWTSDRALLLARTRGAGAGVAMLAALEPTVRQSQAFGPRLRFYTAYADLLRQSHDDSASLQQVLVAVTDAERSLSAIHTPNERSTWPLETRKAYEVLTADLAESNPTLALRAWEWFQTAPVREGRTPTPILFTSITANQLDSVLPSIPAQTPGHITLVLARVLDHYILWSLASDPERPVRQYTLRATPESIAGRAATLLRLCADPNSSITDINLLGQSLYADLLAPADAQLSQAHSMDVELDRSLTTLPFAALQRHAQYLGLSYALTFLPNSWPLDFPSANRLPAQPRVALLEQSPLASHAIIPDDYNESAAIQRLFPKTRFERATLSRDGTELTLQGSPALRSLLAHADAIHYVGHGLEDNSSNAAPDPGDPPPLKLSPGVFPHTRLAVLAACQTLREREDTAADVPSFARIVLAAGAAHVLATNWDVDSRTTSQIMQRFYAALAQGTTFSDALRQSQQSLQQDPASAHPYFWSGFQLVGNP